MCQESHVRPDVEVDYGTATPEGFDRFGTNQIWEVRDTRDRYSLTVTNPSGRIKRLGLQLLHWTRHRYHQTETYHLDINGRELEIRSNTDGRIQLVLDNAPVYTEHVKTVTRNWIRHRELERRYHGDEEQQWALQRLHAEALIENVRFDMDRRRQATIGTQQSRE